MMAPGEQDQSVEATMRARMVRAAALAGALFMTAAAPDEGGLGVIHGQGTLTVRGTDTAVSKIFYLHTATTARTSFSVFTATGGIGFSGGEDIQPTLAHYTLLVDSILTGNPPERMPAKGACDMLFAASKKVIVRSLICRATTAFGVMRLSFTADGNASGFGAIPGL